MRDTLGDSIRDGVERVKEARYLRSYQSAIVTWAINNNLTEGMLKEGVEVDITNMNILQAMQESDVKVAHHYTLNREKPIAVDPHRCSTRA